MPRRRVERGVGAPEGALLDRQGGALAEVVGDEPVDAERTDEVHELVEGGRRIGGEEPLAESHPVARRVLRHAFDGAVPGAVVGARAPREHRLTRRERVVDRAAETGGTLRRHEAADPEAAVALDALPDVRGGQLARGDRLGRPVRGRPGGDDRDGRARRPRAHELGEGTPAQADEPPLDAMVWTHGVGGRQRLDGVEQLARALERVAEGEGPPGVHPLRADLFAQHRRATGMKRLQQQHRV